VTACGEVWLGVERELWRVSRDTQAIEATGLPGTPASLVHAPDGSVVASVRGDATLYVLDAASARVARRLSPQWPDDLRQHGARAINFAFAADGRVAVATGGGHAVALFDPEGRFLARTPPGAYEFTNGLWWSAEGLWTTDTNRFALRLLDPATLAERRAVDLGPGTEGSYLGPARARPGPAAWRRCCATTTAWWTAAWPASLAAAAPPACPTDTLGLLAAVDVWRLDKARPA